jgi:uncharacterized membrane protein YqjE
LWCGWGQAGGGIVSNRGTMYGDGRPPGKSAGQLIKEVSEDISTLVRKEIELAKQELGRSFKEKAVGGAIFAIVAVFGLFALIYLILALRDGLDQFLWVWVADLVTAAVLLLLGGIGALIAKKKLSTPIKADLTKKTIKEDVEFAKSLGRKDASPHGGPRTGGL